MSVFSTEKTFINITRSLMIVVTGATGFLGAHVLCHLLKAGKTVRALKRTASSLDEFHFIFNAFFKNTDKHLLEKVEWFEADILDVPSLEEAFDSSSEVYHCADMVSFLQKKRDEMMKLNVEGTANVMNVALLKKVSAVCHVSSIAALGRANTSLTSASSVTAMINEKSAWVDSSENSNYAISKHKAEMEAWRAVEEGLNVTIVNPGVILGVGNWQKGSCKLFDMVNKGMPFYTHGVNGYVDVNDVAKAMLALVEAKKFAQRFVLVSHNMEMKNFLDTTVELLGKKKSFIKVTPFLAVLAAMFETLKYWFTRKEPAITRETARTSLKQYFYDGSKIEQEISFRYTPINETLEYICAEILKSKSEIRI